MPKHDPNSELLASDLLPPDQPPEEPQIKRIAERRVAGWLTSNRLMNRMQRRPAGNSKRFWKKIEDDDPFVPAPSLKRAAQSSHELYPSERLQRVETAKPRPPQPARQPQPAKPRSTAKPPPAKPVHARDSRTVPSPSTPASKPVAQQAPPIDRRPPRLPNPKVKKRPQGRISVGKRRSGDSEQRPHAPTPVISTAEEIRASKQAEREASGLAPPPKLRGIDSVLAMLGELRAAEVLHNQGVTGSTDTDIADEPRPKPTAIAKPRSTQASKPEPRPEPKPKPKPTPKPINRSPSAGTKGAGMDDLFGGPSESRVRIGKRNKPKGSDTES